MKLILHNVKTMFKRVLNGIKGLENKTDKMSDKLTTTTSIARSASSNVSRLYYELNRMREDIGYELDYRCDIIEDKIPNIIDAPIPYKGGALYNMWYINGLFLGISQNKATWSIDGRSWNTIGINTNIGFLSGVRSMTYRNGTYLFTDGYNVARYSHDGVTWNETVPSTDLANFKKVLTISEKFVVCANNGSLYISDDCVSWEKVVITTDLTVDGYKPNNGTLLFGNKFAFGNDVLITDGTFVSDDIRYPIRMVVEQADPSKYGGVAWKWTPTGNYKTHGGYDYSAALEFVGDKFISVCINTQDSRMLIQYSLDGYNWTTATIPSDIDLPDTYQVDGSLVYGNGTYVFKIDRNTVLCSTDGAQWTKHTIHKTNRYYGLAFGNGVFCVTNGFADGFYFAYSVDGKNWITSQKQMNLSDGTIIPLNTPTNSKQASIILEYDSLDRFTGNLTLGDLTITLNYSSAEEYYYITNPIYYEIARDLLSSFSPIYKRITTTNQTKISLMNNVEFVFDDTMCAITNTIFINNA